MSEKVKLNTLYRVSPINVNFVSNAGRPVIEIYSASSDVTIRATTDETFTGAPSDVPVVTSEAKEGEVYVTDCAEHVKFMSFSCSDSAAVVLVSGLKLIESPAYKVSTYSVADAGEGYKVGDVLKIEASAIVTPTFEVVSYTPADEEEGTDAVMTVKMLDDGQLTESKSGAELPVVGGSGEGATIEVTTTSIY